MDGVLIIDKPAGPTSHDIVVSVRRRLRERKVGHLGTLDPLATGVLPLVLGRATRLAQFLAAADKEYDATIELGTSSDTFDAMGVLTADAHPPAIEGAAIEQALSSFVGTYLQAPPAFSAKKVSGVPAYREARKGHPLDLTPVPVTVTSLHLLGFDGQRVGIRVSASAGFYVRTLAHELGRRLGIGAYLLALRRLRSGAFRLADAISIATLDEADPTRHLRPLGELLPDLPAFVLTPEGIQRIAHGRDIERDHVAPHLADPLPACARLIDSCGDLVAIARPGGRAGALHPAVVLR
jgi:tRNA pseudouridine55 synthase